MNADITIMSRSMVVHDTEYCSVEKAIACADKMGMGYDVEEGGECVTIFGDKNQLWEFLHEFLYDYLLLIIE